MLLMRWCSNDKCSVFCHLCGVQPVFSLALIALSFLDRLQLRELLPPAIEEGEVKRSWKPRTIEKSPISSCSRAKVLFHIIVLHKAHLMTIQCFCLIYKFSRFAMEILSFCHGNLNLNILVLPWKFKSYILPNSKAILCLCKDQHNNTDPARLICPELISFTSCPRERTERDFYVNTLV